MLTLTITIIVLQQRNERREREQRELVKKLREENETINDLIYEEVSRSCCSESTTTSDSYHEVRNRWHSAEDVRKVPKCNIQKQRLLHHHHRDRDQPAMAKDGTGTGSDGDGQTAATPPAKQRRQKRSHHQTAAAKPANRDPPIITTTAATPQDSPNTTIDGGPAFRQWDSMDADMSEHSDSIPSLLRPPSIVGSIRNVQPQQRLQPYSHLQQTQQYNQLTILPIETRSSCPRLPLSPGINTSSDPSSATQPSESISVSITEPTPTTSPLQKRSSFKRFRRSSSKKLLKPKPIDAAIEEPVLNNGRDPACTAAAPDSPPATTRGRLDSIQTPSSPNAPPVVVNRIQNDTTKDINKISPQNSFRRQLATRRMSALITSSQQLQLQQQHQLLAQFTRQHSLKNQRSGSVSSATNVAAYSAASAVKLNYRRRMSSIEQAYEKTSNLNLYSVENMNSTDLLNSKLSLAGFGSEHLKTALSTDADGGGAESPDADAASGGYRADGMQKKLGGWCAANLFDPQAFAASRDAYSLYVFAESNPLRLVCTWFVNQKWFDNVILLFIALNCITLAMERPNIPPQCAERVFLGTANYVFTAVFTVEMIIKVWKRSGLTNIKYIKLY